MVLHDTPWSPTVEPALLMAEDNFEGHPVGDNSVILPVMDFTRAEYDALLRFLDQHGLSQANSGWHRLGYAINFRTVFDAFKFRLAYRGKTLVVNPYLEGF